MNKYSVFKSRVFFPHWNSNTYSGRGQYTVVNVWLKFMLKPGGIQWLTFSTWSIKKKGDGEVWN